MGWSSPETDGIDSTGDFVHSGTFLLHSRFRRVVNFSAGDHLVSLVDEEVGAGPAHIVLKKGDLRQAGTVLEITPSDVKSGDLRVSRRGETAYFSGAEGILSGDEATDDLWNRVREDLLHQAPEKSAVFLLNGPDSRTGGFEAAVAERIRSGVEELRSGRWPEGAGLLKGVGFGLTPTGDDLLAGFLTGLNLRSVSRERILELHAASVGENGISNSMLFFAREGRLFEGTRRLISVVCRAAAEEIPAAVAAVLSRGETSGADFAVGLTLAVQQTV